MEVVTDMLKSIASVSIAAIKLAKMMLACGRLEHSRSARVGFFTFCSTHRVANMETKNKEKEKEMSGWHPLSGQIIISML